MEKKATSSAIFGLSIGLLMALLTVGVYVGGLAEQRWTQLVAFGILFVGIIASVFVHAKQVEYNDTFGLLFGFGFKVTAAATIVMVAYVILQGFIFPEIKTVYLSGAREAAYNHPEAALNKEAIETNLQLVESNYTLIMILAGLFWYLVIGAVASLVGAALPKKREVSSYRKI